MIQNTIISASPDQYQIMIERYASILEKTNNQLSLWSNPYAISIGILTLIVAVGAVIVSVILWRNSSSQRKMVFESIKEMEKNANNRIEESKIEFQKLIEEQQGKLEKAGTEDKKTIEKLITELKREKANIGAQIISSATTTLPGIFNPTGVSGYVYSGDTSLSPSFSPSSSLGYTSLIKCNSCNRITTDSSASYCSNCGKELDD